MKQIDTALVIGDPFREVPYGFGFKRVVTIHSDTDPSYFGNQIFNDEDVIMIDAIFVFIHGLQLSESLDLVLRPFSKSGILRYRGQVHNENLPVFFVSDDLFCDAPEDNTRLDELKRELDTEGSFARRMLRPYVLKPTQTTAWYRMAGKRVDKTVVTGTVRVTTTFRLSKKRTITPPDFQAIIPLQRGWFHFFNHGHYVPPD